MKVAVLATVLIMLAGICPAIVVETASLRNFLTGSEPNCQYDNWISHLAEGIATADFNLYAPYDVQTNGFGDFRVPTTADLTYWNAMLDLFIAGDYDGAQAVLTANSAPFQIVEFHDTDTGRVYIIIREIPDALYVDDNGTADTYDDENGAFTYGWGLFIYNPAGTKPVIITVPHPCDDFPTPVMGYLALNTWNAKYLMINGAGREVRWTNEGSYNNSKSISDPVRYAQHPLQAAYKKFADRIRSDYNKREFSAQIHSYDWNRHTGYANCQISAGNPRTCPNLPIRDLSTLKHDLINRGSHLMLPANTVGTHGAVYLNDFYSVNYSVHEFTFNDGVRSYAVNSSVDLPAYNQNQQMLYTQSGTSDYDVYEPFFHIEMDELPKIYAQTDANYKWFYGWNTTLRRWDMPNLFTNFASYYSRWINDLEPVLVEMFNMNDGMVPTTPAPLSITAHTTNSATLSWNRSSDYDFDTYEILYATAPIGAANYQVYNRVNTAFLASQGCTGIAVTGLVNGSHYYFKIRAKDKNGNLSALSNEVDLLLSEAVFSYSPKSINFGQVFQNSPSIWMNVTITNTGYGSLNLTALDVSLTGANAGEFGADTSQLPVALDNLESVNIPVCMNTSFTGQKTGALRIIWSSKTYDIPLQGGVVPTALVLIGTGTDATLNIPINPYFGYSYSQSIYLSAEITDPDPNISSLFYYWNGAAEADASNLWTVYMGHTTKTSFASNTDWVPLTGMNVVFSGVVELPTQAGWIEIALDTPFAYDHFNNLVIAVDENEAGFDTNVEKFLATDTMAYRSLLYRSDSVNPNPASPPTASSQIKGFPNILLQLENDEQTPVVLTSFTALISPESFVRLTWVTQSETGMLGYSVYRAVTCDLANAMLLNDLIDATNTSQQQVYTFTDTELLPGGTYFYWLECIDFDGSSTFHGPVSITCNTNSSDPTPEIPLFTELKAVYPNPFNPTAFIPYSIANTADVNIRIYNSRGQLLRNFALGKKLPGYYRITWDGTDSGGNACGSGIYHIVMNAGKDSFQRRVVLLK